MHATVRLPSALRVHSGGNATVVVEIDAPAPVPVTVAVVLDALARAEPAVERRIRDERGELRRHVNLFVGEQDVRAGGGLQAPVADGGEVLVLPSVSGGSESRWLGP